MKTDTRDSFLRGERDEECGTIQDWLEAWSCEASGGPLSRPCRPDGADVTDQLAMVAMTSPEQEASECHNAGVGKLFGARSFFRIGSIARSYSR